MAYIDWMIKGKKLVACNCHYGCPCEFLAPPTYDVCEGMEGMEIEEGYFGDVRLDGLRFAGTYHWPGPVHEGRGETQGIIDERADEAQREAIIKILSGEEQEPTTPFNIYGSTFEKEYDPVFTSIDFEWDIENRTGRVVIPEVGEMTMESIKNPVTGKPYRAKIVLPDGWEFREAVMASADLKGTGDIKFDYTLRYGFLTYVAYGPHGLID